MRKLPLLLGSVLVLYASIRILLDIKFRNNLGLEAFMCRFFVLCADDLVLESAERQLAKGGADGLARAEARFQEALRRNPASADRWCDLGEAWLKSGLTEKARTCFSRALDLGAESIQILWRAGSF